MRITLISAATLALAGSALADESDHFTMPFRLQAGGDFIDTDIGHAAPFVHDFDGDGVRDLLVGQFGQGRLRIFRNGGTNDDPQYETNTWFKADHEYGTVPTG